MNYKIRFCIILILLNNCIMFNTIKFPTRESSLLTEQIVTEGGKDKIVIIPIEGVISENSVKSGGLLGLENKPSMVSFVIDALHEAKKNLNIKAVILKIDSPGGTVTASEIIYKEILRFKKETGIPVVAMFMSTAASGGYYVAMSTDKIIALPSNVTGSIGVIMNRFNLKGGLDKLGIKEESITSGENKKIGSPFSDMKPEQEKILKGIVTDLFEQFFKVVKENRKSVSPQKLRELADGRVFSAPEAFKEGLVDRVGYFEDSVNEVTKLSNYSGSKNPTLVHYTYQPSSPIRSPYQISFNSTEEISIEQILKSNLQSKFLYIWSY